MNWYVLQNEQQKGPFTDEQIKRLVSELHLQQDDLVWNDSLPQWVEAGSLPELFSPGSPIPASQRRLILPEDKIDRQRKPNTLIIITLIVIVLAIALTSFFIFRHLSGQTDNQNRDGQQTVMTTAAQTTVTQEEPEPQPSETNLTDQDETSNVTETDEAIPDPSDTTETDATDQDPEITSEPIETTSIIEAPDGPHIEQILDIMHQADQIALNHFSAGFEAEFSGEEKIAFDVIRPDLLRHRSAEFVDTTLAEFYEFHLLDWGFEMTQVFPFYDRQQLDNSFQGVVSQTDREIIVYTYIDETVLYEAYPLYGILILENDRWVIDEYYTIN